MPRKILILVSDMGSGGAERVAANLVNAWAARGDSVTLLVTYSGRGECFYQLADNASLIYLADIAGCTGGGLMNYYRRLKALRRIIRDLRVDVVVSFLTNVNVATLLAARGLGKPVIVAEHNYPPMQLIGTFWNTLRTLTYPYASRVVMLTSEGLDWLNNKIPRARGAVIPNSVSYPLATSEPSLTPSEWVAPERKLLLAVGRLHEQKGFDYLLMVFSELAAKHLDWDLVILGEGSLRETLESQIQTHGLEKRAYLPGRAGNVRDWYQRADLYVMSSRYEGFPMTLTEAMAYGCATVSYDCDTGPRDIIRHGVDGLLVSPVGDVPALASALDQLMRDNKTREHMGQRAIEVRTRYSLESILAMWDKLFDEVTT